MSTNTTKLAGRSDIIPINSIIPINASETHLIAPDRTEWLRTGTIIEDTDGNYPNATVTELGNNTTPEINYTGTSFSIDNPDSSTRGITWDGTHFWVMGSFTQRVYQYTAAGVYTGTSFNTGFQVVGGMDITWDGTYFWIVDIEHDVYKYAADGTYTLTYFNVTAQDSTPRGITWDGNNFWIVGQQNERAFQYTSEFVYTGTSFSTISEIDSLGGMTWDGNSFWIIDQQEQKNTVYQYTAAGVYTGNSFDVSTQTDNIDGITWDGTSFWVMGDDDSDYVYEYKTVSTSTQEGFDYIGVIAPSSKYGIPEYIRIK